jgi:DNA polymerase-1
MTELADLAPVVALTAPASPYPAYVRETRDIAGARIDVAVGVREAQDLLPEILATGRVAVDIETSGLGALRWAIKAVGLGDATGTKVAILDPRDPRQADLIRDSIARAGELLIHNASFDAVPLVHCGLMTLDDVDKVVDTITIARLSNPGQPASLEKCAGLLGVSSDGHPWKGLPGSWSSERWYGYADLGMARYLDGLAADVSVTARLHQVLVQRFTTLSARAPWWGRGSGGIQRVLDREITVTRMMISRSVLGLPVDVDYADDFKDRYSVEIQHRSARLEAEGVTFSNPATMASWLENAGIADAKWPRTDSGKLSTEKRILKQVASRYQVVADYLTVRNAEKVFGYLDTCVTDASVTGCVHPSINVYGAKTGRMSISSPALQQFPATARGVVLSPYSNGLASVDWSSVEVVVAAALGRDQGMLDAINAGLDPYSLAMDAAGIDRDRAKVVILAGQYGQGIPSLARTLGITHEDAQTLRTTVLSAMPGIERFMQETRNLARRGVVSTLDGRVVPVERDQSGRGFKEYVGTNYVVQGTAYGLLSEALYRLDAAGLRPHILLPIHDELVVDADPEVTQAVSEIMSTPPDWLAEFLGDQTLRLSADPEPIGDRWTKPKKSMDLTTFDPFEEG